MPESKSKSRFRQIVEKELSLGLAKVKRECPDVDEESYFRGFRDGALWMWSGGGAEEFARRDRYATQANRA